MSYAAPLGNNYKIPIGAAILHAYRGVAGNWQLALVLAWRPFIIVLLIDLIAESAWSGQNRILAGALVPPIGFLIFGTMFIVLWYRFILLNVTKESEGFFPPGWQTFIVVCLQMLLLFLPAIALDMIDLAIATHNLFALSSQTIRPLPKILQAAYPYWYVAALLVSLRFCLAFPAAAVERSIRFGTAWTLLKGNYWRLVCCVIACYLPLDIGATVVGLPSMTALLFGIPTLMRVLSEALALAFTFASAAVVSTLFADTYRNITGEGREGIASAV